jgi:hypothetical protein
MRALLLVALLACGNKPSPAGNTAGSHGGSASASGTTSTACDALRAQVAELYRAHLRDGDPARLEEAVADNTTMVMNDCVRSPVPTSACIATAKTVQELEARCLIPLDDEGTEGDKLAR